MKETTTPKSFKYYYAHVNTADIVVDPDMQRKISWPRVKEIADEKFDWNLVQPITVALLGGKYYCIDGQTTMQVLKRHNGGKDLSANCKVFDDPEMSLADVGRLFTLQRGLTRPVSQKDKIRVKYNIGDKETVDMVNTTEALGLQVNLNGHTAQGKTGATSTILKIYQNTTREEYESLINVLLSSWGGSEDSLQGVVIEGLYIFMKTYQEDITEQSLINSLRKVSPIKLRQDADLDHSAGGKSKKIAIQILNAYNKGRRANRLPNKFN